MGERRRSWNSCAFPHKSAETWSGLSFQISKCPEIHPYQHFLQTIKFKSPFVITLWNTVTYFLSLSLPSCHHTGLPSEHFLYWDFGNFTHSQLSNPWHLAILMDRNCSKQCPLESGRKVCAQLWKLCLYSPTSSIYIVYTHQAHLHREFCRTLSHFQSNLKAYLLLYNTWHVSSSWTANESHSFDENYRDDMCTQSYLTWTRTTNSTQKTCSSWDVLLYFMTFSKRICSHTH